MSKEYQTIRGDSITATIAADGAELISLKDKRGFELLWQAGPVWPRHSPILFPIVGRLKNDKLVHRGREFSMTQHGIARDIRFQWAERGPTSIELVLVDDAATRTHYPFAFRLAVTYTVEGARLNAAFEVTNMGDEMLPASLGVHPAFNWPLLPELGKADYRLTFSDQEHAPIRRLKDGLLRVDPEPTPIQGKTLALSEDLFHSDALILDRLASSSVRYAADHGPSIDVSWQGFRELGLWSRVGASFLCIEPWHGFASPVTFDGEFTDKPGLMHIAPGAKQILNYSIQVG